MLYMGQSHSVAVPILEDPDKLTIASIGAALIEPMQKPIVVH